MKLSKKGLKSLVHMGFSAYFVGNSFEDFYRTNFLEL